MKIHRFCGRDVFVDNNFFLKHSKAKGTVWSTKRRYSSVGVWLRKCVGEGRKEGRKEGGREGREGKGLVGRGESERILVFLLLG